MRPRAWSEDRAPFADYRPRARVSDRLRVGVAAPLFELRGVGGHGKVWNRTLAELRKRARLISIDADGSSMARVPRRRPQVMLVSGHEDPPPTTVPIVAQVHEAGWFDEGSRETLEPSFREHIAARTEHAVSVSTDVITPSEAARRELIYRYSLHPARVHAIHHGVDPAFRPGAPSYGDAVDRARGERGAPYVLYAASLHPRKNLPALRAAVASLAREGFPHLLAIAGMPAPDRRDSAELERAAAGELPGAPGRVVFLGQPSDAELAALMAGADAFCLPSMYEGFGLTALEAMACGAPVLVSNRGALPEVVGDAGIVVEPTAAAVTEGLRTLLADRATAERLGAAAASRAMDFTWQRTAGRWLEVLCAASRRHTLARR
jgi:glycosyltransferase involved in cell wall biosynthesis